MGTIDSHTHSHLRGFEDLEAMAVAGVEAVVTCAFLPVRPRGASSVRDLLHWIAVEERARLAATGLRCLPALGIHPRCIPAEGLDEALDLVDEVLRTRVAFALGEVGLETGSDEETNVLARQLRLARLREMPVILHTPRQNKVTMLDRSLTLLRDEGVNPARVVIDHLTPALVESVLALGATAGITVQPGKQTATEVATVIAERGFRRIVVDSDLSHVASDPLTVPKVARHLRSVGVAPEAIAAVTGGNIAALLGL